MIIRVSASMGLFDNLGFRIKNKLVPQGKISAETIKHIPVIINNHNRLECLKKQISWLEQIGMKNIYIIDNASTYMPLLEYYKTISHTVFLLNKNVGFMSLWKTVLFQRFKNDYYIYTDPDIIPVEDSPLNAVEYFYKLLQKYTDIDKVGFGLDIKDLPDYYPLKEKVLLWESKFWTVPVEPDVFAAPIDTTFALYRPGIMGGSELKALRTGGAYLARHIGWYLDPSNLSDEELYYVRHAGSSSSWTAEMYGKERNLKY